MDLFLLHWSGPHPIEDTVASMICLLYTSTTPLWYVYMLVGLYLFMPIMSAWLTPAKRKDVKIFLGIWVFSMTRPYLQMLAPALGYEDVYKRQM